MYLVSVVKECNLYMFCLVGRVQQITTKFLENMDFKKNKKLKKFPINLKNLKRLKIIQNNLKSNKELALNLFIYRIKLPMIPLVCERNQNPCGFLTLDHCCHSIAYSSASHSGSYLDLGAIVVLLILSVKTKSLTSGLAIFAFCC